MQTEQPATGPAGDTAECGTPASPQTLLHYLERGWHPFTLPPNAKKLPPHGVTGAPGIDLTAEEIGAAHAIRFNKKTGQDEPIRWQWNANVGIRMPQGVVGIDIDQYGDKTGFANFKELVGEDSAREHLGQAWISTSRPLPSGIYFFRIPDHWQSQDGNWPELAGAPTGAVEIVQRHHRYAVVSPSRIGERTYRWYPPGTNQHQPRPPHTNDLPVLPDQWRTPLLYGTQAAAGRQRGGNRRSGADSGNRHDRMRAHIGHLVHNKRIHDPDELRRLGEQHEDHQALLNDPDRRDQAAPELEGHIDWHLRRHEQRECDCVQPPPPPNWTPGQPIPIGERAATIEAVCAYEATRQPTKPALLDYALTDLWPAIVQPASRDEGERYTKEQLRLKATAAWDRWQAANRKPEDTDQKEPETDFDPLPYTDVLWTKLRIESDLQQRLYHYPTGQQETGAYLPHGEHRIQQLLEQLIAQPDRHQLPPVSGGVYRDRHHNEIVRVFKSKPPRIVDTAGLTEPPVEGHIPQTLIAFVNTTIDITDPNHIIDIGHSPDHLLTHHLPYRYDPTAECPLWEAAIERTIDHPDHRPFFQQFAGSALHHQRMKPHGAIFLVGGGATGKTSLLKTVAHTLGGSRNVAGVDMQAFAQSEWAPAETMGMWANIVPEHSQADIGESPAWKAEVGGDPIRAPEKYVPFPHRFYSTATHIYGTNGIPKAFEDRTTGYTRRIYQIDCTTEVPFADQDTDYPARLAAEAPGILNWLIRGLQTLHNNGWNHQVPQDILDKQRKAHEQANTYIPFANERLTAHPTRILDQKTVGEEYDSWAEENGYKKWEQKAGLYDLLDQILGKRRPIDKRRKGWFGYTITDPNAPTTDTTAAQEADNRPTTADDSPTPSQTAGSVTDPETGETWHLDDLTHDPDPEAQAIDRQMGF